MTGPAMSSLPGSRAMQSWWRNLSAFQPRRLWFAHLNLYRVEVLVEIAYAAPQTDLVQALFGLLEHRQAPVALPALASELQADPGLLAVLLTDLERSGLARLGSTGYEVVA